MTYQCTRVVISSSDTLIIILKSRISCLLMSFKKVPSILAQSIWKVLTSGQELGWKIPEMIVYLIEIGCEMGVSKLTNVPSGSHETLARIFSFMYACKEPSFVLDYCIADFARKTQISKNNSLSVYSANTTIKRIKRNTLIMLLIL